MSAYIALATPMIDTECLIAALVDLGFPKADIECHAQPVALVGFAGDARAQTANLVLRRDKVGRGSNDIGFLRTETGYRAIVSDFDRLQYGEGWLQRLQKSYAQHLGEKEARVAQEERQRLEEERRRVVEAQRLSIQEKARKLGYRVKETREGDNLRMVLVKRVY